MRRSLIYAIATLLIALPILIILWYEGSDLFYRSTTRQLLLLGKGIGSSGYCALALTLVLSTRWHWVDRLFGGLDKVYAIHHAMGLVAFFLILAHPFVIAVKRMDLAWQWVVNHMILFRGLWDINYGVVAYWLMVLLIVLTTLRLLPYHVWKQSHRFLDIVFLLATIHMVGTSSRHVIPLNNWYLFLFGAVGLYSIGWRLVTRLRGGRFQYKVAKVNYPAALILTIELEPLGKRMKMVPGQYAYFSFRHPELTRESHPYTPIEIGENGRLKLLVKASGDYTRRLHDLLSAPCTATTDGSFGQFHYEQGGDRQIWIAGGVGIAPFLCWIDQLGTGPRLKEITLYYCYHSPDEVGCAEKLEGLRGVTVHLRCTAEEGHLMADELALEGADLFLCGPRRMIRDLRAQLLAKGVKRRSLHWEDFEMNYAPRSYRA